MNHTQGRATLALLLIVVAGLSSQPVSGQSCEPTAERHAVALNGEISGDRSLYNSIADRWSFVLDRSRYGWSIKVMDSTQVDLTAITPPLRFGVNHRDIEGWHFRNADNTGSNDGTVNAPQHDRIFLFAMSADAALRFTNSDGNPAGDASGSAELGGRGTFRILDIGLADLDAGQKARLNYLKFRACLTWPKSANEIAYESNFNNLEYIDEEKEILYTCGLGDDYELDAWIKPRILAADFDGDDAADDVAQIRRKSDGQRGIMICRAGTWSHVFGMNGEMQSDLPENGFGAIESWSISAKDQLLGDGKPPVDAPGSVLLLERIEKSQHAIYWKNNSFVYRTVYRFVEPDR